jgi:hypothetical protein
MRKKEKNRITWSCASHGTTTRLWASSSTIGSVWTTSLNECLMGRTSLELS